MVRSNGVLPAAVYVAAVQAGHTPDAAYAMAYPTPPLGTRHHTPATEAKDTSK